MPPPGPPGQPPAPPGSGGFGGPPGGFTPPPAQPYGGGANVPQLEVGAAVSYGWKKFTENVGPFILLMIAVFIATALVSFIQNIITGMFDGILYWVVAAFMFAVVYVVTSIIQAGVWRAGLAVTKGEEPSVSLLTETTNIGPYIVTNILIGLGAFLGFLLCILPGIVWLMFTLYAPILALDKGLEPVDAIKQSIDWVKEKFGQVFIIVLVTFLIYLAGVCLCGIGFLVSAPVALVAIVYSYRALGNETVAP